MTRPTEPPVNRHLGDLAPAMGAAASKVITGMQLRGFKPAPYDTLRTADRQAWLFGKGRTPEQLIEMGVSAYWSWPDCPDGKVTKAAWHWQSWHGFGLAVDIIEDDATPWTAPQAFWHCLGDQASSNGLVWGGSWTRFPDLPHIQWAKCPTSPTADDRVLLEQQGLQAVWKKYGAA